MRSYFRKILLFALFLTALPGTSLGETVSQKQAKAIASTFFNAAAGQTLASPSLVYNGRRLTTGSYFAPFYLYNHPTGGYVLISAENKTFPILAYNLKENFDPEKMGSAQKAILTQYARHIENIRYDSQVPYEAIDAWGNINGYIAEILDARYEAIDPRKGIMEAANALDALVASDTAEGSMSVMYSADQWQQLVDEELDRVGEIPLGLITQRGDVISTVIYGRKGDFYRIWLDDRDASFWRLMPSEILSEGQIAVFGNPPLIDYSEPEEEPFSFYKHYMAEFEREKAMDRAAIENTLISQDPRVKGFGSGHFSVELPETVVSMQVYSLDGQMVQRDTFRETSVANIDLMRNPTGFYFAVFFGESGRPYSVKLFR